MGKEKFVADRSLGRLAKWLRIMGYDTIYERGDIKRHLFGKRTVLTRIEKLKEKEGVVFISFNDIRDQIRELFKKLDLTFSKEDLFTRCSVCNGELLPAKRDEVEDKVPVYVFCTQRSFSICPICGRIYWRGTHYTKMLSFLEKIFKE